MPRSAIVAGLLATFLFLGASRAFFSGVYYHNLVTLAINATVLYTLLLLAPVVLLAPPVRRWRHATAVTAGALVVGRLGMEVTRGTDAHLALAGLGTGAYLVLLPLLAQRVGRRWAGALAVGLAAGVAMDAALRGVSASSEPLQGVSALFAAAPVAVGLVLLVRSIDEARPHGTDDGPDAGIGAGLSAGAALGGWLFLEMAVFGSPHHVARWTGVEVAVVGFATLSGLALGVLALHFATPRVAPPALGVLGTLGLGGVLAYAWVVPPALPWLVAALQAALTLHLAAALRALARATPLAAAWGGVLAGGVALLLSFSFAATFVASYLPASEVWAGRVPWLAVAAYALTALALRPQLRLVGLPRPTLTRAGLGWTLALMVFLTAANPVGDVVEPREPEDDVVRVLAFNVHQGFNNDGWVDPELFLRVLEEQDADVVALQESDTARLTSANLDVVQYLSTRGGYHAYYGPPSSAQTFGTALLSRYPIVDARHVPLPTWTDPRQLTHATLRIDGRDVAVFVVHLGLPERDRTAQTEVLLREAAAVEGPVLLMGDFNSCPGGVCPEEDEPPDRVYADVTARHQDAWVAAGRDADDPAGHTYDAQRPHQRIDYVFASPEWEVLGAGVVRFPPALAASDHLPVWADLRLRPAQPSP